MMRCLGSFCSDAEIAAAFVDEQLTRFLLEQLESSRTTPQAQDDCVGILQGIAATDKGKRVRCCACCALVSFFHVCTRAYTVACSSS